jgi:GTP-binding protein HflX
LEKLFQIAISKTQIVNIQIIDILSEITTQINREIAILINRKGCIEEIFIGEAGQANVTFNNISVRRKKTEWH